MLCEQGSLVPRRNPAVVMGALFHRYAFASALATIVIAGVLGCGEPEDRYPFYEFDIDSDTETDSDSDEIPSTDEPPDSDSDPCPPDYVDEYGRCIRFVNWVSQTTGCGTSWDDAFDNLQDGIDSAYQSAQVLGSCEVWVATGIYSSYQGDPLDTFKMKKGVQIFGGFAAFETEMSERDIAGNRTILTGADLLGQGNSYHVVTGAEEATLDGFFVMAGDAIGDPPHHRGGGIYLNSANTRVSACTFQRNRAIDGGAIFSYDGSALIKSCTFTENNAERGGAIYVLNGAPKLRSLQIENNLATVSGGGVFIESVFGGCSPLLEDVRIENNTSWEDGGGMFNRNCSVTVTGSTISDNLAVGDGGGLGAFRGTTIFTDTTVEGNEAFGSGGGIMANDNRTLFTETEVVANVAGETGGGVRLSWTEGVFDSCLVTGNSAGESGGGFYIEMDFPRVVNTLITGNRAPFGGGVFAGPRGDPEVINCVLHGNRAAQRGGALYNAKLSEVFVANSILWEDESDEIFDEVGSSTMVAYCTVDNGYPGVYVFDEDPMFVSAGYWDDVSTTDPTDDVWVGGDYHLQPESPCIDAANDTVSPTVDADGNTWEDITDVGFPSAAADQGSYDCKL